MTERGITMIDTIQGPPRWDGPDVLLRQTSFRALAEPRRFRTASGEIVDGSLRVRFGEVEARGVALTEAGRDRYDALVGRSAAEWSRELPPTELGLLRHGLAYFTLAPTGRRVARTGTISEQVFDGVLAPTPIVYEDFLPRSAAGIFQSNLTDDGARDDAVAGTRRDAGWLADVIGASVRDPYALYAAQQQASVDALPVEIRAALVG
jgi:uncharacterized glyoxalase superfamily metalloenzyme YdcJ